jgi:hypothetical protein
MASFVGKPTLSIETAEPGFVKITVTYTASFTQSDLQFADGFADSAALFEDDRGEPFGGDDDRYFNWDIGTFRPTSSEQTRVFTATVTLDSLNTELGGEEIYAQVHLRRNIDGIASNIIESERLAVAA